MVSEEKIYLSSNGFCHTVDAFCTYSRVTLKSCQAIILLSASNSTSKFKQIRVNLSTYLGGKVQTF